MTASEIWKPIPGRWSDHEVSNQGRVRCLATKKLRALTVQTKGYVAVTFQRKGAGRQTVRVHVLVAAAFLGPRPQGLVIRHLNGSRSFNWATNLAYGTPLENAADALAHGTTVRGERSARAIYTDLVASVILGLRADVTQPDLAAVFGGTFQSICDVQLRRTYAHVPALPRAEAIHHLSRLTGRPLTDFVPPRFAKSGEAIAHKLTWAVVDEIRADTRSQERMAPDYGVSQSMISQIKLGKAWRPSDDPRQSRPI